MPANLNEIAKSLVDSVHSIQSTQSLEHLGNSRVKVRSGNYTAEQLHHVCLTVDLIKILFILFAAILL